MGENLRYWFVPVESCVMCGSERSRVLGRRLNTHQGLRPRRRVGLETTIVKCVDCGLIYSNPRPVPASLGEHYERVPEDYWRSDYYFDARSGYFADEIGRFRQLWAGSGRVRALDVGAGIGKGAAALERQGFDAYGLEPSASFRERAISNGVAADLVQLATVEEALHEPRSFDFISFAAVLEHLHDPALAIERALCWLAPGGLIHVEVPSARWLLGRGLNALYRAQALDYVTNLSPMHPPYHLYEFTALAFRRHAVRAGVCGGRRLDPKLVAHVSSNAIRRHCDATDECDWDEHAASGMATVWRALELS